MEAVGFVGSPNLEFISPLCAQPELRSGLWRGSREVTAGLTQLLVPSLVPVSLEKPAELHVPAGLTASPTCPGWARRAAVGQRRDRAQEPLGPHEVLAEDAARSRTCPRAKLLACILDFLSIPAQLPGTS